MVRRSLPGLGSCGCARFVPVQPGLETASPTEPAVVAVAFEHRNGARHDTCGFSRSSLRDLDEPQELLLDLHVGLGALVLRSACKSVCLSESRLRLGELAGFDQGGSQLSEQHRTSGVVEGEEVRRSLEEADRRRQIAAGERSSPGRLEPLHRPRSHRTCLRRD